MIGTAELAERLRLASSASDTFRAALDLAYAALTDAGAAPPEPVTATITSAGLADALAVTYSLAVNGRPDRFRQAVTRLLAFTDHRGIPTLDDGLLCDIGDVLDGSALPAVTVTNDRIDPDSLDALLRRGAANFVVNWLSNPRWVETTQSLWQASTRELDAIKAAERHPLIPLAAAWLSVQVPPDTRRDAIIPTDLSAGLAISDRDHIRLAPILTAAGLDTAGVATLPGVTDDAAHKWLYAPRSGHGASADTRLALYYLAAVPVELRRAGTVHRPGATIDDLAQMLKPDYRDVSEPRRSWWQSGKIMDALMRIDSIRYPTVIDGRVFLPPVFRVGVIPAGGDETGATPLPVTVLWPVNLTDGRGPRLHRQELNRLGAVDAPAWRLWIRLAHDWHRYGRNYHPPVRRPKNLKRSPRYHIDHLTRYTFGPDPVAPATHRQHRRRTIQALMVLAARGNCALSGDDPSIAYGRGLRPVTELPPRWLHHRGRGVRVWKPNGWLTVSWSPERATPRATSKRLRALTA